MRGPALQGPRSGDKLLLRALLAERGLIRTAQRPKRAVQFGTRISNLANRREFGSNRYANRLNAGSLRLAETALRQAQEARGSVRDKSGCSQPQ